MDISRNMFLGILEIEIGFLVIIASLIPSTTNETVKGLVLLLLGILLLIYSFKMKKTNKISIIVLTIGIIAIMSSISFFSNIITLNPVAPFWVIFGGIILIIFGITIFLFRKTVMGKLGILGVIFGILYIIIGFIAPNPVYLALLMGIFLITDGIAILFFKPSTYIEL